MYFVESERVTECERCPIINFPIWASWQGQNYSVLVNSSVGGRHVWTHPSSEPSVDPGAVASGLANSDHSQPQSRQIQWITRIKTTKENLTMKTFFTRSHSAQYLFHLALVVTFLVLGTSLSWAQIIVTNTNDSGAGSLRQAIVTANGDAAPNTIIFDPTIFPATIFVQSELPALTGTGDSIDGHVNGARAVVIDGGCSGPDPGNFICPLPTVNGIRVQAANVSVSGLIIQRFPENGISIRPGASNNLTGVSILDSKILENQSDGITVSGGLGGNPPGGNPPIRNQVEVHIIGNEVFTNGDDNITVFGSDETGAGNNIVDVVISGNTIKGAKGNENATFNGDGIRVTAGFGNNVGNNQVTALISDNVFQDMADSAVSIIGGAANGSSSNNVMNVTISGNDARNSGLAGNGTSFTLSAGTGFPTMSCGNRLIFNVVENTSDDVIGPGILVNTGNGSGQVVSGTIASNTIQNSKNATTGVASGDGIIIITSGNPASPASLCPTLPPSTVENVIIELNTIKDNEGRGIAISGGNGAKKELRNVTVSNNQVTNNFDQGIIISGGTGTINAILTGIDVLSNNVRTTGITNKISNPDCTGACQGILVTGGNRSENATISDVLIDGNISNTNLGQELS
jgi:hypothetical protein